MIDTLFLPRRVHVPFAKCPLYSRAIGVQKMCNLEFSTEGTRCSKQVSCSRRSARWDEFLISLSLSLFPSFISELITRTLVNRVCSRWPQKCSRTHHLRRSELGSRFVVHWRGGVAAQSSVSYLSLSLCLCRSRRPANLNVGQLCTGLCSSTNARFPKRGLGRCSSNKKGHRVRPLANEVEVVKGGRGQLSTDNSWTMKVWDLGWESD